jgi:outer membrane protein
MKNKMDESLKDHRRLLSFLSLMSLILFQTPYPASLAAMDLLEAYTRARAHDPLFGSSFYEHEAAGTLPAQGRSLLLPQVEAYGTRAEYYYDSAPVFYRDFTGESMGVSLRQPIFNIPKFYEYRQHTIRKNIGDERFASSEQDLILRLTEAYCRGLTAGSLLDLVDAEKKAVGEQREQAKRMFQCGVATITDVHDAEARYDSVLAQEIEAKNDLDVKMQALKKIVGIEPGVLSPLREDAPLGVPESDNLEDWIDKTRKNHPILKSYAHQIAYQEAELKKNKGQHWPSLELVGGYNRTNTSDNRET